MTIVPIKARPRLVALAALTLLLVPSGALAAAQTAQDYVNSIYKPYIGSSEKYYGIKLDTNKEIRKYFEPSLAALIIADEDAAKKSGDIPELDGDPFIDAQEWDISGLKISVADQGPDKATATVSFKNFKDQKTLSVLLVRLADGWRISDIMYGGGEGSLRGMYAKKKP